MPEKYTLKAEPRTTLGRKVKQLRAQGLVPANIFGSKIKSTAIQIPAKDFLKIYQEAGDTGLIYLKVKGEKSDRPTLVHLIQSHPVTDAVLHVDLRQVNLKEKITAPVPIELTGEAPAVEQKGGILVHVFDEVEVEALPTDFPEKIEVDISSLKEINDSLHVSDLKFDSQKLNILTDTEAPVVHVEAPKEEEEEEPEVSPEDVEVTEGGETAEEGEETKDSGQAADETGDKKEETPEKSD